MAGTAEMDVRRGPLVPEDAIQPLLRPIATARDSMMCAAAGLAGFGVAPLAGHSVLAWPSLAAGVLGVGASIRRGQRLHERNIVSVGVIAGLIPLIGVRHLEKTAVDERGAARDQQRHRPDVRASDASPAASSAHLRVG